MAVACQLILRACIRFWHSVERDILVRTNWMSERASANMESARMAKKYLYPFFILGQSSYNPRRRRKSTLKFQARKIPFSHYIPSTIYFIITVLMGAASVDGVSASEFNLNYAIFWVFIGGKIVTCISVLMCTPFFDNKLKDLWHKYVVLEQYCNEVLHAKWTLKSMEQRYWFDISVIHLLFVVRAVCKAFYHEPNTSHLRHLAAYTLIGLSNIAITHIIFYVSLLNHSIININRNLSKSHNSGEIVEAKTSIQIDAIYTKIEIMKCLHQKLWQIVVGINSNFGWMLVTLMLQTMNNILQPVYYIVVFAERDDNSIMSKYKYYIHARRTHATHKSVPGIFYLLLFACLEMGERPGDGGDWGVGRRQTTTQ